MFFFERRQKFHRAKAPVRSFFNAGAAARRPGPGVFAASFAGGAAPRAGRRQGKVRKNNDSPARRRKAVKPGPEPARRRFGPAGVKLCWLFCLSVRPCGPRTCHGLSAAEPRLSFSSPGEDPVAGQFVRKYVNFRPKTAPFSARNRPCRRPFVAMESPIHPMESPIHPMDSPIEALPPYFPAF